MSVNLVVVYPRIPAMSSPHNTGRGTIGRRWTDVVGRTAILRVGIIHCRLASVVLADKASHAGVIVSVWCESIAAGSSSYDTGWV
jgi:hypothetical protein